MRAPCNCNTHIPVQIGCCSPEFDTGTEQQQKLCRSFLWHNTVPDAMPDGFAAHWKKNQGIIGLE
eukprot:scaffold576070_cov27-Prasinocladus_malaysianus.AAC.1